jgi:NitT/TauT family transport system ATP-binding protein
MTDRTRTVVFSEVAKSFAKDGDVFFACRDLSFDLREGEIVAIVGETGCGKSTAMALLLGLQAPTTGTVRVLGMDPFREFDRLKGRIGIIFQNDRLLPWRTALENVAFGLEIQHVGRAEREEKARAWLARVGLGNFVNAYPHQLSGGMRQRVSIARTFAIEPPLLLADEAFTALDELTASALRRDLIGLIGETRKTTLFITHSVPEAAELAERVLVFGRPGHVVHEVLAGDMIRSGRSRQDVEEAIRYGLLLARGPRSGSNGAEATGTAAAERSVAG